MAPMAKTERECFLANLRTLVDQEGRGCVTEMAEHFGLHRVTMSNKIHGHDPIDLGQAEEIAAYFDLALSDMLVSPKDFQKFLAKA